MALRRVVVTGLGALTPIGNTAADYWQGLVNGKSGAAPITRFDAEKFRTKSYGFESSRTAFEKASNSAPRTSKQ